MEARSNSETPATRWTASWIASLPASKRNELLSTLTVDEKAHLIYRWDFWCRESQQEPAGDWRVWLLLAGRGFGKTRVGSEWIRRRAESGLYSRFALIGETAADVRDVMVEGESGILAVSPPWFKPVYEPSKRRLTWPNGAIATCYTGDAPDQLRGPQHDAAWADEPAKWKYPQDAWDNMEFGLRIGPNPQVVATTTPRPIPLIRALVKDPQTVVTRGNTYENRPNLAAGFIQRVLNKYEGTRLGRQELHAEILDDNPNALWQRAQIDATRVKAAPDLVRVVVAIDPAVTSGDEACETGIVVGGLGADEQYYVLVDRSLRATPRGWARQAILAYQVHKADRVVAEVNNGGDLVEDTIRNVDPEVAYKKVTASRGKLIRAEPIAALYEQGHVHHVGTFPELEDQLCDWVPGDESPDRLDALVWALTELSGGASYVPQCVVGPARQTFEPLIPGLGRLGTGKGWVGRNW